MKKIFIDTSFTLSPKTGVGNYVITLIKAIENANIKLKQINCKSLEGKSLKNIPYNIWLNTYFFMFTLLKKPSAIFFPAFAMPFFKVPNVKYITCIHDLVAYKVPESMGLYLMSMNKLNINITIKSADLILAVSETVKQEIIDIFNVPENKIKLTYNSFDSIFISDLNDINVLEKYKLTSKNYILSVATLNKRKNLISLIKGFEQISNEYPNLKLVLVGGMGNEDKKALTSNENILFTGYVSDEELPTLYKNASMYVFPSIYEGFGIPILEAQASKTPVICSDIPVFHEVAQDSALYCQPTPECIADKIKQLINYRYLQQELIERGFENINRFSAKVIQQQIKDILTEAGFYKE